MSTREEALKTGSRHLRGSILEELEVDGAFSREAVQILKFHGTYQQNDRDARKTGAIAVPGSMVRVGIPGGILTPAQYLALDGLADTAGDGSMRITSRQDIQFHRVSKTRLRPLIRLLNENLLTTLAACGDVVRNVISCPAPFAGEWRAEVYRHALDLSRRFKPATRAYYEIWIDGVKTAAAQAVEDEEPLYGPAYLPRKFKIGFAAPGDNCIDVYTNDVGIVPLCGEGGLEGFTVLAGGGLGFSPGVRASHPRLADPVCTVDPDQLFDVVRAIVTIHRDFGNRSNRKLARLKYVFEEWGPARFLEELAARVGRTLRAPRPVAWSRGHDHLGWRRQGDGRWFLGVRVLDGRISGGLRSTLREAVPLAGEVRLTAQQNLLLAHIPEARRRTVERLFAGAAELPPVLRHSMACPALPTCGQAITEAERVSPEVLRDIQQKLRDAGLGDMAVTVRMTGCPNGCARPATAEIGIIGQSVDMYALYLGGSPLGTRLGEPYASNVRRDDIGETLAPAFALFAGNRLPGESFGDFCHRTGIAELRQACTGAAA
ncbi:MAG: NADPH-dependent assimilatory sulfite reductase hemoprotein subunit [Bryobacteraceae bacterium]